MNEMPSYFFSIIILIAYALGLIFTLVVRNILLKRALLDYPNERSSHKIPVPRGGGLAILMVLIPGMILAGLWQHTLIEHAGLIAGVMILALISWFDDRKGVPPGLRLAAHLLAAGLGSLVFTNHPVLFGGALPFWLDRTLMIIGWAWFTNLYNFMDGIDGLTSVETIFIASGFCLIAAALPDSGPFSDTLSLLLTGASLGFLAFNWHPAKIFLGDVGSVPLGYLAGFLLLALAVRGLWAPALILPLYYLADSGITLIKRILRGEKFWQAHRQHFYQRAAQGIGRHDRVVVFIAISNAVLIAAAILAITYRAAGLVVAAVIVAALLRKMQRMSGQ